MYVYVCTYVFVVYEHNTARNISNITATISNHLDIVVCGRHGGLIS